jgi:hypothetical protein
MFYRFYKIQPNCYTIEDKLFKKTALAIHPSPYKDF